MSRNKQNRTTSSTRTHKPRKNLISEQRHTPVSASTSESESESASASESESTPAPDTLILESSISTLNQTEYITLRSPTSIVTVQARWDGHMIVSSDCQGEFVIDKDSQMKLMAMSKNNEEIEICSREQLRELMKEELIYASIEKREAKSDDNKIHTPHDPCTSSILPPSKAEKISGYLMKISSDVQHQGWNEFQYPICEALVQPLYHNNEVMIFGGQTDLADAEIHEQWTEKLTHNMDVTIIPPQQQK